MPLSTFDLFTIGIGPSSSHTVGPMRAAKRFADTLNDDHLLERAARVRCELFGSLGATGHGHGSDRAVLLGLEGEDPATVDTATAAQRAERVRTERQILLSGRCRLTFDPDRDLILHRRTSLPLHPNGMRFTAFDAEGNNISTRTYYSVGGGFVVDETTAGTGRIVADTRVVPFPFTSATELLAHCATQRLGISQIMLRNELVGHHEEQVRADLVNLWTVMEECVDAGCHHEGVLPGGLKVRRRAPDLYRALRDRRAHGDPLDVMDWVNVYAIAVNEENASGGRIVTAPTNGAAGIIPAVLHYLRDFVPHSDEQQIITFLLTAAAIGIIIKENASISGAEMGCQGEVGSACAMAAAGLCEVLGGTPRQVENAAEIALEHNLGLTCDPVGGLVQIPCIERNAIAAVKAINATRLALNGTGNHKVSLDQAIKTMRETGHDMHVKYKETSRGGLAVNVVEC